MSKEGKDYINFLMKFRDLARNWKEATGHYSNMRRAAQHSSYRKIIEMGKGVIPIMLNRFKYGEYDHWFIALRELTGESPVKEEHRGVVAEMANDWIKWGIERGLIK